MLPYLSGINMKQMYTITSPPGKHGSLGRKIQRELEHERTERCLNAIFRQLVHHDDSATNAGSNPASLAVDEPLKLCASNNENPGFSESPILEDSIVDLHSNSQINLEQ